MEDFEFIKGYENLYKINRQGEIYSCHYKKIMKQLVKDDGYLYVDLRIDGKRHKGYIHRLLALQYIDNPENLPQVDHIDRNKINNDLNNLRWVNHSTNMINRKVNGSVYEDKRANGKIYWKSNYTYYIDGIKHYKQKSSLKKEVCEEWLNNLKTLYPR